ncbi:MAG TPA: hypothetical protein VHW00_07730 [Thermoanaerobaculia bacterium]|nr:hypothetical protein [Thermoanaerobaculia bacterium]
MKTLARCAFAFLLIANVIAIAAQELDVFESSDFVDPRLRGVEFGPDGFAPIADGSDFAILRVLGGASSNYQWRTRPSDDAATFVSVAGSYYRGVHQLNVELTELWSHGDASLPRRRATVQFGRYLLTKARDPETNELRDVASRLAFTWSVDENRLCVEQPPVGGGVGGGIECDNHYELEVGMQFDTSFPLLRGRTGMGSFIVTARDTSGRDSSSPAQNVVVPHVVFEDGTSSDDSEPRREYRATFVGRVLDRDIRHVRLGLSYDVSGEYAGGLRMGAVRGGVSASIDLAGFALTAIWRPSYVPNAPQRNYFNEFAFMIDRAALSRIVSR